MSISSRPWLPDAARTFYDTHAERLRELDTDALEQTLFSLVEKHERFYDHACLTLYAGTNVPNPKVSALLGSSLGSRPNLGYPGDKFNRGMVHAEALEVMLAELLKRLFKAPYAEYRVGSGSLANLYTYMATCQPGDVIMAFSDAAAGHVTHHEAGAAGLYGLKIHEVPFDAVQMDVDVDALAARARELRPKLIIVAGSMCLFPYNVRAVRDIADEVGAYVMYDAAHMGGLIAGGAFQQPLAEGAHVMTGSSYKSFGGPPSGFVVTTSPVLAERLEGIAFPGLTANFDLGKSAAMVLAILDLLEHGPAYAEMCIQNAQALAQALADCGVNVFEVGGKGFTASHHVAVLATPYGGARAAAKRLEDANILVSGIDVPLEPLPGDANALRLGTQELTRWGMKPDEMRTVAKLMARVLVNGETPERVREDVRVFREGFRDVHFVRP
jgi:glycine hydroxymethyltransferase